MKSLWIGGRACEAASGKTREVCDPASGAVLESVELESCVAAALVEPTCQRGFARAARADDGDPLVHRNPRVPPDRFHGNGEAGSNQPGTTRRFEGLAQDRVPGTLTAR